MEGTREIPGRAVICAQPDGPRGFQKPPLSKERGERLGRTQADRKALGQMQLSLAVVLVCASAGMRATSPLGRASKGLRQGRGMFLSCSPNTEEVRVTGAIALSS